MLTLWVPFIVADFKQKKKKKTMTYKNGKIIKYANLSNNIRLQSIQKKIKKKIIASACL